MQQGVIILISGDFETPSSGENELIRAQTRNLRRFATAADFATVQLTAVASTDDASAASLKNHEMQAVCQTCARK